mgnify:CR=1 FL=1
MGGGSRFFYLKGTEARTLSGVATWRKDLPRCRLWSSGAHGPEG